MTIICFFFPRYLREQNHPRKEALFREAMMVSSYARDLREFKVKAFRRLKL